MPKVLKKEEASQIARVSKEEADAAVRKWSKRFNWLVVFAQMPDDELMVHFREFNDNDMPPYTKKETLFSYVGKQMPYVPYSQSEKELCEKLYNYVVQRHTILSKKGDRESLIKKKYQDGKSLCNYISSQRK